HRAVIEPARMLGVENGAENGTELTFRIGNEYEGAPIGRFRLSVTSSEFPEAMPEAIAKILQTDAGARTDKDRTELRRYFLAHPIERRRANEQLTKLEADKRAIENKIPSTMVMQEMEQPRHTFMLVRGQDDHPREKVTPAV